VKEKSENQPGDLDPEILNIEDLSKLVTLFEKLTTTFQNTVGSLTQSMKELVERIDGIEKKIQELNSE
jgi:methyl-accepting chemotaxis protein